MKIRKSARSVSTGHEQAILKEVGRTPKSAPFFRVLPGIETGRNFQQFSLALFLAVQELFPEEAVRLAGLLTIPGWYANPRGSTSVAKEWNGDKFSLVLDNLKHFGEIATQLRIISPVSMKITSGTSFPFFRSNSMLKMGMMEQGYQRIEDILNAVSKRDYDTLRSFDLPLWMAGHTKHRAQVDSPKDITVIGRRIKEITFKERKVFDYLGDERVSSKLISTSVGDPRINQAMRTRVIYSKCTQINCILQNFFTCLHKGLMKWFDVFSHTSHNEDLKELTKHGHSYLVTKDQPEHDKHTFRLLFDTLRYEGFVAGGLDRAFADLITLNHYSPDICPKDSPPFDDYTWSYDPYRLFDYAWSYDPGNTSGQAGVSPENKIIVFCMDAAALMAAGLIPEGRRSLVKLAENKHECIRMKNNSDNGLYVFKRKDDIARFLKGCELIGRPVELDEKPNWSGMDYHHDGLKWYAEPSIPRGLTNTFNPEFPITAERNSHWGAGWRAKCEYYRQNPQWPIVERAIDRTVFEFTGNTLTDMTNDMTKSFNWLPSNQQATNLVEHQFVMNPDKAFYWFTDDELKQINPELFKLYFILFSVEKVDSFDRKICSKRPIDLDTFHSQLRM